MKNKFILDVTAGFRMMWFNKAHPNCIYLDERPECEPDIVADFRDLKQFEDNKFRLIIFDPPHIIKHPSPTTPNMQRDYGALSPDTWDTDLIRAFNELWRILKPMGVLLFKWHTCSRSGAKVMKLFPIKPLIYQVSRVSVAKKHKNHLHTLWFCFMKIPE